MDGAGGSPETGDGAVGGSPPPAVPRSVSGAALLIAWLAIGVGNILDTPNFNVQRRPGPLSLAFVVVGVVVIFGVAFHPRMRDGEAPHRGPGRSLLMLAAAICGAMAIAYPLQSGITASRFLDIAACLVVLCSLYLGLKRPMWTLRATMVLFSVAGIAAIRGTPNPPIDVWYMLQAASHGLLHGHNIYTQHWASPVPWELKNTYVYLPGSAVVLTPFHLVFGDVRYGLLSCLVVTAELLGRLGRRQLSPYVGSLLLLYPGALYLVAYSWIDPIVLLAIVAMILAVRARRLAIAILALAAALTIKQYALVAVPLAALWRPFGLRRTALATGLAAAAVAPWLASSPSAFWHGVITTAFELRPRPDSLSLAGIVQAHGVDLSGTASSVAVVSVVAIVVVVSARRPGTAFRFALGLAVVMSTFDVLSKETFFNEWALAAGFCLLAIAAGSDGDDETAEDSSAPDRRTQGQREGGVAPSGVLSRMGFSPGSRDRAPAPPRHGSGRPGRAAAPP